MAKKCEYCEIEGEKLTKEHIIPKSIIDLFPECELSLSSDRQYIGEAQIRDVCANCNNNILGKLDSYGKKMIEQYFNNINDKRENQDIEYDYDILLRWLLKIFYNCQRVSKRNVDWYKKNIDYILSGNSEFNRASLFMGLTFNNTDIPMFMSNTNQIESFFDVAILTDSMFSSVKKDKESVVLNIEGSSGTCLLKIGTAIFFVILWNDIKEKNLIERKINSEYPYKLLTRGNQKVSIERVTNEFSYMMPAIIEPYEGMIIAKKVYEQIGIRKTNEIDRLDSIWFDAVRKKREEQK